MATTNPPVPYNPTQITHGYTIFIGVGAMMTVISTTTVVLRFLSRRLTRSWSWDDWAIVAALVFAYGFLLTTIIIATVGGAGRHTVDYTPTELEKYLQVGSLALVYCQGSF